MKWILYILAFMVFYDFSLHVYDLLRVFKKAGRKHPLGAYYIFNHFSKGNKLKREKVYQIFWTTYWGIAFLLFLAYFLMLAVYKK